MPDHEPPLPPCTPVWRIGAEVDRADIPALCDRFAERLASTGARVIVCDVAAVVRPDAAIVEALARLQLTALRRGRRIRLRGASAELLALLSFVGLRGVLPMCPEPRTGLPGRLLDRRLGQPVGQAEEREQPLGVEEEVEPGDPAA